MDLASTRRSECSKKLVSLESLICKEDLEDRLALEYADLFISYLHDSWSEIRKDTAKTLKKADISKKLSLIIFYNLEELSNKSNQNWQIVHGTVLGRLE